MARVAVGLVIVLAVIGVLGLLGWRAIQGDVPSDAEKAEYVASLETTVLPVVEDLQVAYIRTSPTAPTSPTPAAISSMATRSTAAAPPTTPPPFDDVVRADHARLAAALEESRTPIERAGGKFTARDLRYAFFMSTHGAPFATSWELLYDPDDLYPKTATDLVTFTPVPGEAGWWFVCCAD